MLKNENWLIEDLKILFQVIFSFFELQSFWKKLLPKTD